MEWKDIPGFEGFYQVSEYGHVKSLQRKCGCHKKYSRIVKEKILKPNLNSYGYARAKLLINGKGKTYTVHRLVMLAFVGPSDLHVNHIDMNIRNNHVSNLEYVTMVENIDKARKIKGDWGYKIRNEKHYLYKITPEMAKEIRELRATKKIFIKDLAAQFGISERNVRNVTHYQGRFSRPNQEDPSQVVP